MPRGAAPKAATWADASSRTQAAKDSAIAQRKTAVGLTSTGRWSGSITASNLTISRPPQSPGPMSLGNNSITAIVATRWLQSLGALVTSAVLKSGPAASAKECGSTQAGGRGRGNGTFWTGAIAVRAVCFLDFVGSLWSGFNFVLCCCVELPVGRCMFCCCRLQFGDANKF